MSFGESDEDDADDDYDEDNSKKKDKKLVFLSRSVLEKIKEKPMTTGTQVKSLKLLFIDCKWNFGAIQTIQWSIN